MKKLLVSLAVVGGLVAGSATPAFAKGPPPSTQDRVRVVVYVESQGLYFDSIVGVDLPQNGPFQKLIPGAAPNGGLATEFGPGDPGHLGGRWWVDLNGDDIMNDGDHFFSCPLLGPGSETPPPA